MSVAVRGRGRLFGALLTLFAVAIGLFGYAQAGLARTGQLPDNFAWFAFVFVGCSAAMYTVVAVFAPRADPLILPLAILINGIGLAMINRLDISFKLLNAIPGRRATPLFGDNQLKWFAVSTLLCAILIIVLRDHRTLRRAPYLTAILGLGIALLPMVPGLGKEINGARIWIEVHNYTAQPAELAKIMLAVFFAGYLVTNRDNLALAGPRIWRIQLPRVQDMGPLLAVWVLFILLLVVSKDLGSALLLFGLFVAMLWVATNRSSWVAFGLVLAGAGSVFAYYFIPHVGRRVTIWLHALDPAVYDARGGSAQVVTGLFGMATGGLTGSGWGKGYPNLIPYSSSDFITASLAEELGLVGILGILVLYLLLAQRGIKAALGTRDGFGKLLATGLSFILIFQLFVTVGGITRVIPLTGLTAPLLAAGGSSLVTSWIIVFLLIRVSDGARQTGAQMVQLPQVEGVAGE